MSEGLYMPRLWPWRARGSSRCAWAAVAAVCVLVWAFPASTQDDGAGLSPAKAEAMSRDIEDALGIYIIHKDKREALEKVLVKERRAEIWFLQPLGEEAQTVKCNALKWLFLGRMDNEIVVHPIGARGSCDVVDVKVGDIGGDGVSRPIQYRVMNQSQT